MERVVPLTQLIELLRALSQETGASFSPDTFEDRLRIQKALFLLQVLSVPGVPEHRFGFYLRGPYSSDLTRAYFNLRADAASRAAALEPVRSHSGFRFVCDAVRKGNEYLEAAATLAFLQSSRPDLDRERILGLARELKPRFSGHLERAAADLARLGVFGTRP